MVKMVKQVLEKKIEEVKENYNCNENAGHLPVLNSNIASYLFLLWKICLNLYDIVTEENKLTVNCMKAFFYTQPPPLLCSFSFPLLHSIQKKKHQNRLTENRMLI